MQGFFSHFLASEFFDSHPPVLDSYTADCRAYGENKRKNRPRRSGSATLLS
jgi:hypothetical protein